METALGRKVMIFICNNCGEHTEQENWQDYEDLPEIVYEDDYGCPLCRSKEGFTPMITYIKGE